MVRALAKLALLLLFVFLLCLIALAFAPRGWLAARVEPLLSNVLGTPVSVESLDVSVFTLTPGVMLSGVTVSGADDDAVVSANKASVAVDLMKLLKGELVLDTVRLQGADIQAAVDSEGQANWLYLTPANADSLEEPDDGSGDLLLVNSIQISDVRVFLDDRYRDNVIDVTINGEASTTQPSLPTTIDVSGTVDDRTTQLTLQASSLVDLLLQSPNVLNNKRLTELDVDATLGQSTAVISAVVEDFGSSRSWRGEFEIDAQGMDDIQVLTQIDLPRLPPVQLTGDLLNEGDTWILRRFDGVLGDSDLQGDIRVNPGSTPPVVYANLISKTLDLDDLAGLIGGEPDPDEPGALNSERPNERPSPEVPRARPDTERLLPSETLAIKPLTQLFDGAVEYRAETVVSPTWPIQSLDVRVDIDGSRASVSITEFSVAGGVIDGELDFSVSDEDESSRGEISLQVKQLDLRQILASAGLDTQSVGQLGGQIKLWVRGDSLAQMAASADGGAFFLMTGGELDAILVELLGIDLTGSLSLFFTEGTDATRVNCAFADLQSRSGIVDIATLVLDTDDTVMLADGSVDLTAEELDVTVEPHPKDASILAAQTAVSIAGPFTDISVLPGASLPSRAAAAAVLASVVSPAAAILPFIESGSGQDSSYCSGMVTALDSAR